MTMPARNVVGLFAEIWPRIAGFSHTPSLLVIVLIANVLAALPTPFRIPHANLDCATTLATCAKNAPTSALAE